MTETAAQGSAAAAMRVERQRLNDIGEQLLRSWIPLFTTDTLLAWLIYNDGLRLPAALWWVAMVGLDAYRFRVATRYRSLPDTQVAPALAQMRGFFGMAGVLRGIAVALAFYGGQEGTAILVSMIIVGLATGAVATGGGDRRAMLYFGVPVFTVLALCWISLGTPTGVVIGLLFVYLFHILLGYVDTFGKQNAQLIDAAEQLRIERDRVQEVNQGITQLAEQLRTERDRAAAANESKTRFLAAASHDLRQPLQALALYSARLDDIADDAGDERLDPVCSGLHRVLAHSREQLAGLLDVSRLDAGVVEVRREPVELGVFLASVTAAHEEQAREKGLTLQLECPPELAEGAVSSDPALLRRLLGNLLNNAVKFTASGWVRLQAQTAPGDPQRVWITVADSGPGIPPEEHSRVFEEFYQLGNPGRDRLLGLGLGLSIVRRLARLLEAPIELHSEPGHGASFRVELGPLERAPGQAGPTPPPTAIARPGVCGRVLVIDDEDEIRTGLDAVLSGRGWQVMSASGSLEALALLQGEPPPDVLLVDLRLGSESGIDAIALVRAAVGHVPAIIVTGDIAPERLLECAEAGCPVLHKPVDVAEMSALLGAALGEPAAAA